MKIIVPMAGTGQRFVDAGYEDPKPLIKVWNRRIIEYILDMFNYPDDEFVFICNETHLKETDIRKILFELKPGCTVVSIPDHKRGPVHTVQAAYKYIREDEEVIVAYCDNPSLWNRKDFEKYVKGMDLDGCILTHTGFHPHTLSNTKMAYTKLDEHGLVTEIKEKACYTDNPMNEHASTGVYYFRHSNQMKKYFDELVAKDINYNGEYYITLVYNLLIADGLRVGVYDTPFATVFGTPEEVKHCEAWATIVSGQQVKTEEDLLNSYRYWIRYGEASWKMKYR